MVSRLVLTLDPEIRVDPVPGLTGLRAVDAADIPSLLNEMLTINAEFSSRLEGYENVRAYCYNCQHWNGHCVTRWPFFTVCFIPLIPLAMHKYKEVQCYTCRFTQDLRDRPDITPDTRPPPGMQYGIQPPPQAQGGWQQQPPLQSPPQAQGGLGYK
ncbi:Dynein light chain type 1/2 [Penicillium rubens]|uniref:Dynein light chain type 1/2 n=1 Tax=Penicillium rubens TaxID=1108849 RepID=UPI002A5AF577|nr:Dynein light chain type 1/2 [Penicillium rubens]KAJ5821501.1 Dynein light chain type 1/2 [Penicillium rubens]